MLHHHAPVPPMSANGTVHFAPVNGHANHVLRDQRWLAHHHSRRARGRYRTSLRDRVQPLVAPTLVALAIAFACGWRPPLWP